MTDFDPGRLGVVAIGRNEGERLRRCLQSLVGRFGTVVYVDSGSTDGSVEMARGMGVDVVELDMNRPFTMARGRNAGLERLRALTPDAEFIHFIDGDCEMVEGWVEAALGAMASDPNAAMVCGRRRERFPGRTIYNLLTDMEWAGPAGDVRYCAGDALARVAAVSQAGGFNPALIAGEEPELCYRLRRRGWRILRLGREMTRHDAAITSFGQWWRRSVRCGHAYAEGMAMHGRGPERFRRREVVSGLVWGLGGPLAVLAGVALGLFWAPALWAVAAVAAAYAMLGWRVRQGRLAMGDPPPHALLYALFCIVGKAAHAAGILLYAANRVRGKRAGLIEYKGRWRPRPLPVAVMESAEA
jgi:GT2 family glycosyltransferase